MLERTLVWTRGLSSGPGSACMGRTQSSGAWGRCSRNSGCNNRALCPAGVGCSLSREQWPLASSATFHPFSLWNCELKLIWEIKVTLYHFLYNNLETTGLIFSEVLPSSRRNVTENERATAQLQNIGTRSVIGSVSSVALR